MSSLSRHMVVLALLAVSTAAFLLSSQRSFAVPAGSASTIEGSVTDPSGAVIAGASVEIADPISGYKSSAVTDAQGQFRFINVPFNPYHLTVSAAGFNPAQQDVVIRSTVPVQLKLTLQVASSNTTVNVQAEGGDLVEAVPIAHTDVDSTLAARLPEESLSSGLSSVIAAATPGVVADSNGFFHPQGEHADTSFNVDNQPINDQQSRLFSNQLSTNTIQSMEVITGVPPAEYGDKASLVIHTTTKSGLNTKPQGSVSLGYGSFGTSTMDATFSAGGQKWGNFIAVDGLNSGRFLDSPEFTPIHDHGNNENIFDRIDYQRDPNNAFHLNLAAARSWFQIPNDYDQLAAGQDQRQQVRSFNFAPGYTHIFNSSMLLDTSAWVRQDRVGYFPSADAFFDLPATLAQNRRLTNTGIRADFSFVKGIHNAKVGLQFMHTLLSEAFNLGVTDPAFNAVCINAAGAPVPAPTPTDPLMCASFGFQPNPGFHPGLLPFDLTRGGALFDFHGRADIKQEAAYVQDSMTIKQLTWMVGVRLDNYNGLSHNAGVEPRTGISYLIKQTNTVLRGSYGRLFLTPYNENLVLSSTTGQGGLAQNIFGAFGARPLTAANRNQFDVGIQQAFGRYLSVDSEYFWKFTNNDYDFDVLFNSPLAFPVQWRKSKIDGLSVRVNFPEYHGLSAYSVMGHTRARFFGPETGGLLFNSPVTASVFRIDHDQAFQQNTHLQYQPKKDGPWFGFTWSYQSGEVAGAIPFAVNATTPVNLTVLTADQQLQAGIFCGAQVPTLSTPLTSCAPSLYGATRVRVPAPGTENDDRNPPRIAPRHLFDAAVGIDNVLRTEKYRLGFTVTAVNLTNQVALYNFLSTFSGTHFVTPRSVQAQMTFGF